MKFIFLLVSFTFFSYVYAEESPNPFINLFFKAQTQDTYKYKDHVFEGVSRSMTGKLMTTGFTYLAGSPLVLDFRDSLDHGKTAFHWHFTLISENQAQIKIGPDEMGIVVSAEVIRDSGGELLQVNLSGSEMKEIIDVSRFQEIGEYYASEYGINKKLNSILIDGDYRCYFRRSVVRCFNDIQYILGTL